MTQEHPITPPEDLLRQWCTYRNTHKTSDKFWRHIAIKAARWGADWQLEQCVGWVNEYESNWLNGYEREGPAAEQMRNACRPKPPSLKEQALETLRSMRIAPVVINGINVNADVMNKYEIIRRAIESMPD